MTREEAIKYLIKPVATSTEIGEEKQKEFEAYNMAIEALQTEPTKAVPPSLADVYKWERDIALSQLEEYGIGFAEKKRDDLVEVVRCKDCYHAEDDITHMFCVYFHHKVYEDDYCSNAVERRKNGEV